MAAMEKMKPTDWSPTAIAADAWAQWMDFGLKAATSGPEWMRVALGQMAMGPADLGTSKVAGDLVEMAVRAQRAMITAAYDGWRLGASWRAFEMAPGPFGLTGYFRSVTPDEAEQGGQAKAAPAPASAPAPAKPSTPAAKVEAQDDGSSQNVIETLLQTPQREPDDLTQIKGIGPKLCEALHEMGIFHFHQIANLTDQEIEHINDRLRFKGRIERERWVEQAKALI